MTPHQRGIPLPILAVLALCTGFSPFAIDAYLPGLPAIAEEFQTSASLAQFTLTGFLLALGASQLIIGPLSDQLGRKKLLLGGLTGTILASIACALAPNIWVLIGARMAQGAFGAAGVVIARAIVADLGHGIGIAKAFALLMSIQSIAPVVAPLAGGLIVPQFGWRAVFWFLAVLGVGTLIGNALLIEETLPPEERRAAGLRSAGRDMASLLTSRSYLAPMLTITMSFAIMFAYISASPFVLQRIIGLSEGQYSIVFTINASMLLVASVIAARIVDRTGMTRLIFIFGTVTALAVMWLAFSVVVLDSAAWAILVGFFIVVTASGFTIPNAGALTAHAAGNRRGTGSAMMGATQYGVAAITSPLTGIGDGTSAVPMVIVMAVAMVGQLVFLLLTRREHPDM